MTYPIVALGDPILRKVAQAVAPDDPNISEIIANMYETMYNAKGVGLAAPQVGLSLRLFVIDSTPMMDEEEEEQQEQPLKKIFINAQKIEEYGETWAYAEGCLSIPGISENVMRPDTIRLRYYDENFQQHEEVFTGLNARVIQHEYDHIEGVLFIDYLKPLKRRLLQSKLERITKGIVSTKYRMRFAK